MYEQVIAFLESEILSRQWGIKYLESELEFFKQEILKKGEK